MQANIFTHNWIPEALFRKLSDVNLDMVMAIHLLVKFCMDTGMVFLNEVSYLHLLATWLVIEHEGKEITLTRLDTGSCYQRLLMLKECVRNTRHRFCHPWSGRIQVYASHPNAFQEAWPDGYALAYADSGPIKFPYDGLADHVEEGWALHTIFTRYLCFQGASALQLQPQRP